jgi:hypothetical protein
MNSLTINELKNPILETSPVQLANAATQRPGNSSYCEQLLKDIKVLSQGNGKINAAKYGKFFINENDPTQHFNGVITKSISQRYAELLVDKNNLWNIRRTGADSYEGHRTFLRNQQTALSYALNEFKDACSENGFTDTQHKILGQAIVAENTPIPLAPDVRLREFTNPGNFDFGKVARIVAEALTQAGTTSLEFIAAVVGGIFSAIFGFGPDRQLGQKELDDLLAQLSKDQSKEISTSSSQSHKLDKPIDRSTASAEELLEHAFKVAAGLKNSGKGESPEFEELMKQLNEQKSNLEKLNQVADQGRSNQNQREIG